MKRGWTIGSRIVAALSLTAAMAVSCPDPAPPEPPAEEEISEPCKWFLDRTTEGLYIGGEAISNYKEYEFQRAWAKDAFYRIQRDDQTEYLHLTIHSQDSVIAVNLTYRHQTVNETLLIIPLARIRQNDTLVWLWNEVRETGVVLPSMP